MDSDGILYMDPIKLRWIIHVRILRFEDEKLRNDDVSGVVVDWAVDTHNSLLQQSREDLVCSLALRRVFNHHWDQIEITNRCCCGGRLQLRCGSVTFGVDGGVRAMLLRVMVA
ncbi:hypothetical protein ACFE04_001658 [Oxalis oulophora]